MYSLPLLRPFLQPSSRGLSPAPSSSRSSRQLLSNLAALEDEEMDALVSSYLIDEGGVAVVAPVGGGALHIWAGFALSHGRVAVTPK